MPRLFILGRLYKWWGCWDVTNLIDRQAAHVDRTVILTCGVYTISVDKVYPSNVWLRLLFTWWSLWVGFYHLKGNWKHRLKLFFQDFQRQWRPMFLYPSMNLRTLIAHTISILVVLQMGCPISVYVTKDLRE